MKGKKKGHQKRYNNNAVRHSPVDLLAKNTIYISNQTTKRDHCPTISSKD